MGRAIRVAVGTLAIVVMISIGAFLYLTRGVAAPTEAAAEAVMQLSAANDSAAQMVFRISADDSTAEYTITEVLNGSPKSVVGATSQVAGDILVNLSDPAASQIGEIAINARTFATDDSRRDNSVARFILQSESDANQFIDFTPTSISGLTDTAVNVDDTLTFKVTGNLTIAGVTKEATFNVTATLKTADQLTGTATATVARSDFNLNIPNVPFVANVGADATIKLNFVANAVSSSSVSAIATAEASAS